MNIRELIQSTGRVKNRGKNVVFQKKFGSIYLYNKTVQVPKGGGAIIVNMMIGGVTDMIKSGGKRTPVAYHKVSLALNIGDDGKKEYTTEELISTVRLMHKKYADENEFPPQDVLKVVLDHPADFFPDATVFKTSNAWWCCCSLAWGAVGGNESAGPPGFEVCRGHPRRCHSAPGLGSLSGIRKFFKLLPDKPCKGQEESSCQFQRLTLSTELMLWAMLASPSAWPMSDRKSVV